MFVSFYFLILTLLLYFQNKNKIFAIPKLTKQYSISVLVPAHNEERTIEGTINAIYNIDYQNISEVIVINDGSTDNTLEILKKIVSSHKYKNFKVINKKNSGKADSLNKALKFCNGELVVVCDADSYPERDCFKKMVGFFDDASVGAATPACIPRNRATFLERLQLIEYKVIAFTRKLLEYIEGIYVVPGTAGMYRKKALEDIGGFDTSNITEDIEATWHLVNNGWKVRMCLDANVATEVPNKIGPWYRQRRRWALGGIQCVMKYKNTFMRRGMLGAFIMPFFTVGLLLGFIGITISAYLIIRRLISSYLMTQFSIVAETPVIAMSQVYITPSVLNYFGVILFVMFLMFTLFTLSMMKDKMMEKQSFFNLLFYMTIYLLVYPLVLITATKHYLKGKNIWK